MGSFFISYPVFYNLENTLIKVKTKLYLLYI